MMAAPIPRDAADSFPDRVRRLRRRRRAAALRRGLGYVSWGVAVLLGILALGLLWALAGR